ncbi:MAG: hypothetical protein WCT19_00765 [Candidatus Paceibacterota bacterium]|jgi:hypothetical protein
MSSFNEVDLDGPEQRDDEVQVGFLDTNLFECSLWKTRRLGKKHKKGQSEGSPHVYPLFVKKEEVLRRMPFFLDKS